MNRPKNYHLLDPLDWQQEALRRAAQHAGTEEGRAALIEANRYAAFVEVMQYVNWLEEQNNNLTPGDTCPPINNRQEKTQ